MEDDEPIRSLLLAAIRRRAPVVVDTARDGFDALELLRTTKYAVIVIDLMMPRMNGFELLDHLTAEPLNHRPVIFVMTAFDGAIGPQRREIESDLVHGIIRKPFDLDVLVDTIIDCAMIGSGSELPAPESRPFIEPVC